MREDGMCLSASVGINEGEVGEGGENTTESLNLTVPWPEGALEWPRCERAGGSRWSR